MVGLRTGRRAELNLASMFCFRDCAVSASENTTARRAPTSLDNCAFVNIVLPEIMFVLNVFFGRGVCCSL